MNKPSQLPRKFLAWSKTECDGCGNEFQVSRINPVTYEANEMVMCSDCEIYERAYQDGVKHGIAQAERKVQSELEKFLEQLTFNNELPAALKRFNEKFEIKLK